MGLLGDPSPATTTTSQTYSAVEEAARKKALLAAGTLFDASGATQGVAPIAAPVAASAPTLQGQKTLLDWSTGQGADYSQMLGTATQYGLQGAMDVKNNPYLQDAMKAAIAPVTSAYNDPGGVIANIRGDAVQSGQYGGTRKGLESGIAGGKYLQTIGEMTAKMGNEAYNTGQDTFAKTLGLAPATMTASMQPGIVQSAVGSQQEGYTAAANDFTAANTLWEQNKGWIPLQNYTNIVNGVSNPVATTTMSGGQPSTGSKLLAGAAGGYMIGGPVGAVIGAVLSLL